VKLQIVEIGKLCSFIRNGISIKQSPNLGGIPITRIETIANGDIDSKRVGFADIKLGHADKYLLEQGDILFSHINSEKHLGKCAFYSGIPSPLLHGMNLVCLRPKENIVIPKYLYYMLNSSGYKIQLRPITKRAVNQASVSTGDLRLTKVQLLPFSEQTKIVEILDQIASLRRKRKEVDEKTARILPALFYKMFGDPATNPMNWETGSFDSLFDEEKKVINGKEGSGIPYLGLEHVEENTGRILINEEEAKKIKIKGNSFKFDINHILYGKLRPYLNKVALPYFNGRCTTELVPLLPKYGIPREFIASYLQLPYVVKAVMTSNKGARMPRADMHLLKKMEIPIPPKDLQLRFVKVLQQIKNEIEEGYSSKSKIENIINILIHRAFAGRLTSAWRERHRPKLEAEMAKQMKAIEKAETNQCINKTKKIKKKIILAEG
jgi:type I restriction enzyme, S subunit